MVENVRAQLEQVINDLELSAGVDPAFIARYNKMKEELDGYAENVRKKEKDLAIVKKQVEKTLGMFNPALDALVGVVSTKFGAAFERECDRLGCQKVDADARRGMLGRSQDKSRRRQLCRLGH